MVLPADRSDANGTISSAGNERSRMTPRIVLPTAPVAPTTATRMSAHPRSVVAPHVLGDVGSAHDARDLDRGRGDHLDVDAGVAQDAEGLGGDARVRLHSRADERDLAHVGIGLDAHPVL